jgi:hypothetical protein
MCNARFEFQYDYELDGTVIYISNLHLFNHIVKMKSEDCGNSCIKLANSMEQGAYLEVECSLSVQEILCLL